MHKRKKRHNDKSADIDNSEYQSNGPLILISSRSITYYASALNQSQGLLLVCGGSKSRGRTGTNVKLYIYTLEGYLVTYFPSKHVFYSTTSVCVYFDSTAIVMVNPVLCCLAISSDYLNDVDWVQGTVFDCDKKGDIYLAETNRVSIYSSNFQFERYFELNLSESGNIITLLVKEYLLIAVLKYSSQPLGVKTITPGCQMYRYSLETDELLQRWELSDRYHHKMITNINANFMDRYMDVLMTCDGSKGYCVWDKDGRISFHQLKHQDTHPKSFDTTVGCSLTEYNQLIYVLRGGCIKIYNI